MTTIDRDERTIAVENASYRWGYKFVVFGVLVLAMYRALVLDQPGWDLLALVIIGGFIPSVYQGYHHVLTRRWGRMQVIAIVAGAVVALLVALVRGWR